jgi:hypothetical protein
MCRVYDMCHVGWKRAANPTLVVVRLRLLLMAATLPAVFIAGCADAGAGPGAGPTVPSTNAATTGSTVGSSPGPTTGSPSGGGSGKSGSRLIGWIKDFGIAGGAGGDDGLGAYSMLAKGDCANVAAWESDSMSAVELALYRGAGAACLAAFHRRADHWRQAEQGYAKARGQVAGFDCFERAAFTLLRSLVEAHQQAPDARFVKQSGGRANHGCPRILRVEPNHGPAAGGYQVRIVGENLPRTATIWWDGTAIRVPTRDGREATVTVPPGQPGGGAGIWVEGWPAGPNGTAPLFDYDPVSTTTPSPAAT